MAGAPAGRAGFKEDLPLLLLLLLLWPLIVAVDGTVTFCSHYVHWVSLITVTAFFTPRFIFFVSVLISLLEAVLNEII